MWRPGDILVIALVLAMIGGFAAGIYSGASVDRVRILRGENGASTYPAWDSRILNVSGPLGETRIEISDGTARIVASPCQQKICINRGWLSHAGETVACLPNRISVTLLGDDPRFDAMNF